MTSWLKLWVLVGLLAAAMPAPARAQIVAAGADEITGEGVVDGWTNVLYVNESNPFSFVGTDHGLTTTFDFWVNASRVSQGVVTPFIAEPLSDSPEFGDEFIVRAIGTTREAGAHWQCGGLYQYPFHDSEVFEIQDGWVAGFMSSDPLSERPDALSPIPFIANYGTDGWLTGTGTAGSGVPIVELNEGIVEGASGTDVDAFGFREYQFQILAASGDVQPPIGPGGKVGEGCPVPVGGNVAGAEIVVNDGGPDGWTNVLYINEERPFDFSDFGTDRGTLDEVTFAVAAGREFSGLLTPFVAEPLVDDPQTGDDFVIRAIGTTREGGVDWEDFGVFTFPFSDDETFEVQDGWVAGFLSSDPLGESDLALSPVPFIGNAGVAGWLTGSGSPAQGAPVIELDQPIIEGVSGTNVDAFGFRNYQFQVSSLVGNASDPGDFNSDGRIDVLDIDLLTSEVLAETNGARFDLNADGVVDGDDRSVWVEEIRNTYFGDSNLDGEFNSSDFVVVFTAGKYEDAIEGNATWEEGDWDGDHDFTSSDFVVAFSSGGYEIGPRTGVNAVPEPSNAIGLVCFAGLLTELIRRKRS